MTKERLFPLKVGSDGQGALKEQVHKHVTGDQARIKVLFGLDAELRIVEPSLYIEGSFVNSNVFCANRGISLPDFLAECKKENRAIFYTLNSLTYVCVQNIVEEKGQVVKNTVNFLVPVSAKKQGLVCNDVSIVFPRHNRSALANNFLPYSLSRV